jgi:hypothetical protein
MPFNFPEKQLAIGSISKALNNRITLFKPVNLFHYNPLSEKDSGLIVTIFFRITAAGTASDFLFSGLWRNKSPNSLLGVLHLLECLQNYYF